MSYRPAQREPETTKIPPERYRNSPTAISPENRSWPAGEPPTLSPRGRYLNRVGVVEVSGSEPAEPALGLMWLDTATAGPSTDGGVRSVRLTRVDLVLTTADDIINVHAFLGGVLITLPSVSDRTGKQFDIKKVDASRNKVTIIGAASNETIDRGLTAVLTVQDEEITVINDGTVWGIY